MVKLFFIFLFIVSYSVVLGQSDKRFRLTHDPDKLARKITRHCATDSARVDALYRWTTKNIKYDAKRFMSWKTEGQTAERALKRRKTLCTGYAEVFTALCDASGIKSVVINGYTKGLLYDVGDTTYLPTHSWNKYELNGSWFNADATWDAGYLSLYKTSKLRQLCAKWTLGLVKSYVYKPHFIRKAQMNYFRNSENEFAANHLPENPNLIGFAHRFSALDFDRDSSHYYLKNELIQPRVETANAYMNQYYTLDWRERDKDDGKQAIRGNPRNYFGLSRYHYHLLYDRWERYKDNEAFKYDSTILKPIISRADSILYFTTKTDSVLQHEFESLMKSYADKRNEQRRYNSAYRRYLIRKRHERTQLKSRIRRSRNKCKKRFSRLRSQYSSLRFDHMNPPAWPKSPSNRGIDSLVDVFRTYTDTMNMIQAKREQLEQDIASGIEKLQRSTTSQRNYIDSVAQHFYTLSYYRMLWQDDRDYPVVQEKASFPDFKTFDSALDYRNTMNDFLDAIDSHAQLYKLGFKHVKRQEATLMKIRRRTQDRRLYFSLDDDYRVNHNGMKRWTENGLDFALDQLDDIRRVIDDYAPIDEAKSWVRLERRIYVPSAFIRGKTKWHRRKVKFYESNANRIRLRAQSKLDFARERSKAP